MMLSECSHSSIHVALSKVFNSKYVKQNCIYVTESVHFQTLMSVKRSQAFVQTVCASTRLAVSVVNAPRGSVTMTCSWSVKVIQTTHDPQPDEFSGHKWVLDGLLICTGSSEVLSSIEEWVTTRVK